MSMPAKGKHHHLSHHHQQQHHSHQQQFHHPQQQQQQQTHQQHQQHPQQQQQQQQQHVNVNQPGVTNTPQAYNAVVANTPRYVSHAGSEFHVPGQNYVAQPGGHVGGGGGSVGVQGGRGPPSLGSVQSIGQTTAGINPGGPQSGQQQPPQSQTPGVQQQQSQGPAPTTTPPVHTPSPQEMGKQAHLQAQPPMQQVYMPNPPRPVSQGYYQSGPRPQPPRGLGHRSGQGGGTQVVGMQGVGGGGGQATAMFTHQGIPVPQGATMYVQNQVPSIHPGSHQQAMYSHALMPLFSATQQRHQTHQGQPYYPGYGPHAIVTPPSMYSFAAGQGGPPYFYPPTNAMNISRASANAVSGGAQHVGGPLAGAQGAGGVPQGTLQQPSQQPQPIPSMAIPLAQTEVYTGMNGDTVNANTNTEWQAQPVIRKYAILDIVNPTTGTNVAQNIYGDAATRIRGTSRNHETPRRQNAELAADFAARVAKAASEVSEPGSPAPPTVASSPSAPAASPGVSIDAAPVSSSAPEHSAPPSSSGQSIPSSKVQTNSSKDAPSQSNSGSPTPAQNTASLAPVDGAQQQQQQPQQTLSSSSPTVAAVQQPVHSSPPAKPESKPLQFVAPEFWPRGEVKPTPLLATEESASVVPASKENVPAAQPEAVSAVPVAQPIAERPEPPKVVAAAPTPSVPETSALPAATPPTAASTNVSNSPIYPSNTANPASGATAIAAPPAAPPAAAPTPAGINVPSFPGPIPRGNIFPIHGYSGPSIDFPTLTSKATSSSSPPRRKNNNPHQQSQAASGGSNAVTELPPSGKEQHKERKISDRSNTGASRGATPTPTHAHPEHHQRSNGEAASDKSDASSDAPVKAEHHQQKFGDGKAKQKNKNKLKHKDLNRKGAEKEGTDMDAFVNPAAAAAAAAVAAAAAASKPEGKMQQSQQENKGSSVPAQPPSKEAKIAEPVCPVRESAKGINERENNETKIESSDAESAKLQKIESLSNSEVSKEIAGVAAPLSAAGKVVGEQETAATNQQNHKDSAAKESTPTIEESGKSSMGVCNMPAKTLPNDVVDHSAVVAKDEIDVEAIVAQKNEENSKVSALHASSNENKPADTPVIEKHNENTAPSQTDAPKAIPPLKYTYSDNQWSPRNVTGKKEYDREFLMKLQDDPKSRIRPAHLPEMEVVLKECITNRSSGDFRPFSRDLNPGRHDSLFPGFAKTGYNQKLPVLTKKSYQGKSKSTKPNVIHVSLSLREDVKLRETENAWRPARLKPATSAEEDKATEALYKKVRSVLNKLTPQKFETLVSQVRALEIDTQEKLQGVIDLVFEKAVDEPNFSVAYALMCKELAQMKVMADEKKPDDDDDSKESAPAAAPVEVNFRKLIIERCQMQFSKQTDDEVARTAKVKEIDETTDPEKKKELQANLDEHDRRVRVRSVGNIRFIGELFKKEMLTTKIMHFCIYHLLSTPDEESLECLCKLLTTIGKVLDSRVNQSVPESLGPCFVQLAELAGKKNQRKISSRIRFMIQDVIDLRANQWIPRRDENKPKTMDQIQKEAECERSDTQLNNTPMNTPRKDDRNNDRRRNRGGGSGMEEGGWSQPVGKTRQQPYSVETSKLSTKAPAPDEMRLGSRHMYAWGAQSAATSKTLTPNKYALLESMPSDLDKRPPLQISGSRSTGPRDYGRSDYKSPWENKGSRLSSHQMNSFSSGREALMEGGRSQSITMLPSSMKMKPQPTSAVFTGSSSSLSSSTSNKPQKTEAELVGIVSSIMDLAGREPKTELFIENAMEQISDYFNSSSYELFVRESVNGVLERTAVVRHQFSALFSHLINHNILPLSLFQIEFEKVLDSADDLVIDIPKIWTYFADLLSNMVVTNAHPLAEMKTTAAILKTLGTSRKLIGELLTKLVRDQGPTWVAEKWDQSGLQWSDIVNTKMENVDDIIKQYKLEFLNGECKSSDITPSGSQLTNEQIHDHLPKLMRESNFDHICSWILANVGTRVTEPQFIRILMTAILDVTVEERHSVWKLNENAFKNHQTLIKRFIADADADLELQCLFAIQAYVHKLEHPPGLLFTILTSLHQNDILSDDAFLTWESHKGEFPGHAVAIKGLTSFFTGLREPDSDDA